MLIISIAPVITIDGHRCRKRCRKRNPQAIAQILAWNWLDSGAIYRVLAFSARYYDGTDVSKDIRNDIVGHIASKIAYPVAPGLIADGRDMGTVVFPDAQIKIFLYASEEARAYRRRQQLQDNGFSVNFKRLLSDIK